MSQDADWGIDQQQPLKKRDGIKGPGPLRDGDIVQSTLIGCKYRFRDIQDDGRYRLVSLRDGTEITRHLFENEKIERA
jgi:hypothetical protein